MSHRFFRSQPAVYEAIRSQLDAAWGLPNSLGTVTCFSPLANAVVDAQGRPLLGVRSEWCDYEAVAAALPQLLASGAVEEIDAATYFASSDDGDGVS